MPMEFHVSRAARQRYRVDESLFSVTGNVLLPGFPATRRLAAAMNTARDPGAPAVQAGDLNAMGLVDEILHVVVAMYRETRDPQAMLGALSAARERVGEERLESALRAFSTDFPALSVHLGEVDPVAYLDGVTDGIPNRAVVLEEMSLLRLANLNTAFGPFRELFDDRGFAASTAYVEVIDAVADHFRTKPPFGPDGQPLVEMLRAPAIASPDSLAGQLKFIRDRWGFLLGRYLDRLVVTLDVLSEEERAAWLRWMSAHGDGGGADSAALRGFGVGGADEPERFSADRDWMPRLVLMAKSTYVWLDQLSRAYSRDIRTLDAIPDEELDTLARRGITGLWLIGLWERSEASARIKRMMGNPEAVASAYSLRDYRIADDLGGEGAYADLRERAWARGIRLASDMVPNHMGIDSTWVIEHPDRFLALPEPPYPAYSFSGADLSHDDRVEIRLEDHYWDRSDAAVVFQRRDRWSGETRYIYHGNDGTSMPWNDTAQLDYLKAEVREAVIRTILDVARRFPIIRFDAAMTLAKKHVQRLWFPEPGHGGAIASRAEHAVSRADFDRAMPEEFWREVVDRVAAEVPDTLLLAEAFWLMEGYFVRTLGMHRVYNSAFMHMLRDEDNAGYRLVIKNTLEFDPEILRRYVNFMNNPDEKTAVEQFGKGDKYFGVATLMVTLPGLPMFGHGQVEGFGEKYGMEYRRAYHDETPDGWLVDRHERELFPLLHRRWLFAEVRDFLLYDLTTPDGHVNEDVFAYSNRVGRERALVVYNNRYADAHGRIRMSVGFAEKRPDGSKTVVRRDLADGLALRREDGWYTVMRDAVTGLEHIRSSRELAEQGLEVRLGAYGRQVFLDVREVADGPAGQYGRLAARLGGAGVPSVEDALRELQLQPVHDAFRGLAAGDLLGRIGAAASGVAGVVTGGGEAGAGSSAGIGVEAGVAAGLRAEAADRLAGFLSAVGGATGVDGDPAEVASRVGDEVGAVLRLREMTGMAESGAAAAGAGAATLLTEPAATRQAEPAAAEPAAAEPTEAVGGALAADAGAPARAAVAERLAAGDRRAWSALLGYLAVHRIGELAPGGEPSLTSRAWFDELRLNGALAGVFRDVGLDESEAWRATDLARLLVRLPTVSSIAEAGAPGPTVAAGPTAGPRVAEAMPAAAGGPSVAAGAAGPTAAGGAAPAPAPTIGVGAALPASARALLATWLADDDLRRFIRVNRWEGVAWFEQEAFEELLGWAEVLDAVRAAARPGEPDTGAGRAAWEAAAAVAAALTEAAGTAGYRLDGLREVAGA
jgi:glycosidase